MKIKSSILKDALSLVKPGLASKEIIDQTTSFAFVNNTVVTYNDEICIIHPLELEGVTGAIKAEEMFNFIKKVTSEEIDVTVDDSEIVMKSGRAKVGFALAEKIVLPLEEELQEKGDWKLLPEEFIEATKFSASCAAEDMSTPKLTCVHFEKSGKIEAADNFRIVRWTLSKKLPFKTTLIPASSMKEVIKINPNKVSEGNGWIHFKNNKEVIISCRTFDESYVDIETILYQKMGKTFEFTFPEETSQILDRASVFTRVQAKQTNEEIIDVTVKNKVLTIECKTDTAWFKENIGVKKYKGDDFMFRITPYLLQDILKGGNKCQIAKNMLRFETENWIYLSSLRGQVE